MCSRVGAGAAGWVAAAGSPVQQGSGGGRLALKGAREEEPLVGGLYGFQRHRVLHPGRLRRPRSRVGETVRLRAVAVTALFLAFYTVHFQLAATVVANGLAAVAPRSSLARRCGRVRGVAAAGGEGLCCSFLGGLGMHIRPISEGAGRRRGCGGSTRHLLRLRLWQRVQLLREGLPLLPLQPRPLRAEPRPAARRAAVLVRRGRGRLPGGCTAQLLAEGLAGRGLGVGGPPHGPLLLVLRTPCALEVQRRVRPGDRRQRTVTPRGRLCWLLEGGWLRRGPCWQRRLGRRGSVFRCSGDGPTWHRLGDLCSQPRQAVRTAAACAGHCCGIVRLPLADRLTGLPGVCP